MKNSIPNNHYDLHSYIDDELSPEEKKQFEKAIKHNTDLQQSVCELRKLKQQTVDFYQKIDIPPMKKTPVYNKTPLLSIAASLVLAVGLGFMLANLNILNTNPISAPEIASHKIVLHIDSNEKTQTKALLQKASQLLAGKNGSEFEVEIITNDHGIKMFEKSGASRDEIITLLSKYNNLKLIACQRALSRREAAGNPVELLPAVQADQPAIDVIINKIQHGWSYYKF